MLNSFLAFGALAVAAAPLASAHAGCGGYQHGVDLFKRDPKMDVHIEQLKKRHPQVNIEFGGDPEVQKRQATASRAARPTGTVTQINSAAVAAINSGTSTTGATTNLPSTPTAGSRSPISGAPVLPNAVLINPANYPALDRPPPTDTPEVQQWLSEIDLSGVPNWSPTQPGGCANASNAQAVSEASARCWWTCGGCNRATDVSFCPTTNTWGLSYDDGPSPYTPKLLNYLDAAQLKTTFFIVGSRAISRPAMLQYEYLDGHQIATHTWSHFLLTTLTNEQIVAEFGWSKKIIYDILGVTPNTFRPPYGDIDDRVRYIAAQMGLEPIIWTSYAGRTFDTRDWQIASGIVNTSTVISNFDSILSTAPSLKNGFIVLEHDLYEQSVDLAVDYVLPSALQNSALSLEPIINCLGQNMAQAYIETATNSTSNAVTTVVGASGVGFVPGVSTSPTAIGGGATGTSRSANSAPSTAPAATGVSNAKSAASTVGLSAAALLLGTAAALFALA